MQGGHLFVCLVKLRFMCSLHLDKSITPIYLVPAMKKAYGRCRSTSDSPASATIHPIPFQSYKYCL